RGLARRHASRRGAFREPEIIALAPLLANPGRAAHAAMSDLTLRIELARPLGKVVAGCLARAAIDARAFATRLCRGAIGGAELYRGIVHLERAHDLRLVATRRARERGDRRRARLARKRVDEPDATRGFVDGETEHRCRVPLP